MDIIEAIKSDKAYNKYKALVKKWEKDFKDKHRRIPTKLDIKEAPTKVKYAYKRYFEMKSAALEKSLMECTFDDEEFHNSPELPCLAESFSADTFDDSQEISIDRLPSSEQLEALLSNTCDLKLPSPRKIVKSVTPQKKKEVKKFAQNLSKKLFESTSFSIRNPRKSLPSKLSQKAKSVEHTQQSSPKPHTITELNFGLDESIQTKVIQENNSVPLSIIESNVITNQKVPSRSVNEGWLERASGIVFEDPTNKEHDNPMQFGLSNINLKRSNISEKPVLVSEYINTATKEPPSKKLKLDEIVSNVNNNSKENSCLTNESDHYDESYESKSGCNKKQKTKSRVNKKRTKKHVSLTEEEPPIIDEYIPTGLEKNLMPRHTKDSLEALTIEYNEHKVHKIENDVKITSTENYRKINIEKKVYVRGKKSFNYSKFKKQQWKDKKALHAGMEFPEGGKILCFKCNQPGHMARYCIAHKGDSLLALEAYSEDTLPSIQDIETKIAQLTPEEEINKTIEPYITHPVPDSFLRLISQSSFSTQEEQTVFPVYSEKSPDSFKEVNRVLKMFGHTAFKSGQEEAIMRILCGKSTLLILSTGGGKSLCYQLPAYIYSQQQKCITLVISPLVSLMEDQVVSMPEFLKGGCLHTNQSETARQKIIDLIKDGVLNVLLISPEALVSGDKIKGLGSLFKNLPPIAFACIDEAHCVSQWSHNFRPSYLMICRVLREKLKVNCILGLTATASRPTIQSIIDHINVPDGYSGVITNPTLPDNLILSVSYEKDKDRSLISLLSSEPVNSFKSIIVYCIRRDECQRVAAILRSSLQEPGQVTMERKTLKRKRMSYTAEAYHAGLTAAQRRKIQNNFMDGTLRIIVATVAFGMGINKSDIRCIIHYNIPSSFESYVQEVGRAGRDGLPAYCRVFMNHYSSDKDELFKHIHANTIDRHVLRKLLQKVFVPCNCNKSLSINNQESFIPTCQGHEVAFSVEETVEELDLASENIATLLCYLELHPKRYIKVLNNAYITCKIFSYGGAQKLIEAAKNCPPLAMAYALERKRDPDIIKNTTVEFPVIDVAAAVGWESGVAKYHLKNLEWTKENGSNKRSALKVEFSNLGFRVRAPGDLSAQQLDEVLDDLHDRVNTQERAMIYQLEEIFKAFSAIAQTHASDSSEEHNIMHSNKLKKVIENYFDRSDICAAKLDIEPRPLDDNRAILDIKALIHSYRDCKFTGRAIARILQGIQSPNYPAIVWGRCKFWRSHIHEDFHALTKLATQQIIDMR